MDKNAIWKTLPYKEFSLHLENINNELAKNFPNYVLKQNTFFCEKDKENPDRYETYFHIFKDNVKALDTKKENFKNVLNSSFIFAKITQIEINKEISYVCELLNICPLYIIKNYEHFDGKKM